MKATDLRLTGKEIFVLRNTLVSFRSQFNKLVHGDGKIVMNKIQLEILQKRLDEVNLTIEEVI